MAICTEDPGFCVLGIPYQDLERGSVRSGKGELVGGWEELSMGCGVWENVLKNIRVANAFRNRKSRDLGRSGVPEESNFPDGGCRRRSNRLFESLVQSLINFAAATA